MDPPIDTYVRNAIERSRGAPRNNLRRDVACTRTPRVHTRLHSTLVYTCARACVCIKLSGKVGAGTCVRRARYSTQCLRPDRAVMCLRVISGSQLTRYARDAIPRSDGLAFNSERGAARKRSIPRRNRAMIIYLSQ